ncbi:MAG: glycosyltransferase family 4 protein [Chloroflexi bacterium]|nr:glycosyltransferase family 4 protein [Chloroflexota bacterium]
MTVELSAPALSGTTGASRRRIAFVVPRYGLEVIGGGETHCRQVAERLVDYFDVDVLTTCALDYSTWEDHYAPGVSALNEVTVRRFSVPRRRDPDEFARFTEHLFHERHTPMEELEWMIKQGPASPALLTYIRDSRHEYDLFVFMIYLYFPTYFGLPLVPEKAVFLPLAHDEPPFHLSLFRPLYHLPRLIVYNTPAEQELIRWKFGPFIAPGVVLGSGVELPCEGDPVAFRREHGLADDFLLYVGRINESKWCHELIEYFGRYKAERRNLTKLVLIGPSELDLPRRPDIIHLGVVADEVKVSALRAATVFVMPSHFESLSYATLEAWLAGTAVLVSGAAEVLRDHCRLSNGGLYYRNYDEFAVCLDRLLADPPLRRRLAANGRRYAEERYLWEKISEQLRHHFERVAATVAERGIGQ